MVSCANITDNARRAYGASMHLVLIAWVYVIGMMALTSGSIVGGLLLFVLAGLLPGLAIVAFLGRRLRERRAQAPVASTLEERVHDRDDRDA